MRRLLIATAASGLLALSSCLPFPTENPISTYKEIRELSRSEGGNLDLPDVSIVLNAAGGDAIQVYSQGDENERVRMAEIITDQLDEFGFATTDGFDPDVATVELDRRLTRRIDDRWEITLDAGRVHRVVSNFGYDAFNLLVCHPTVEARIVSSRPPDFDACYHGAGWVVDATPLTVSVALVPDVQDYLVFAAAVTLGTVLLSALAWFIGTKLREGPFRRRTSSAVALGIIVGGIVLVGVGWTVGLAAGDLGPSDNHTLVEDLSVGLHALSALIPALVATIPGLIFTTLLVKKRPWPDEPIAEQRPWPPPPPPPGPPGAPPPPPRVWSER